MANLRKRDEGLLIWMENFLFDILQNRQDIFIDVEGWHGCFKKYLELWSLNERLIVERKQLNAIAKQKMHEYRSNPETREKAKAYAREYMREYNKRKKNAS